MFLTEKHLKTSAARSSASLMIATTVWLQVWYYVAISLQLQRKFFFLDISLLHHFPSHKSNTAWHYIKILFTENILTDCWSLWFNIQGGMINTMLQWHMEQIFFFFTVSIWIVSLFMPFNLRQWLNMIILVKFLFLNHSSDIWNILQRIREKKNCR